MDLTLASDNRVSIIARRRIRLRMEPHFKADEFSQMPPEQRAEWCRQMALEARQLAEAASPCVRSAYVELAKQWTSLADEIERELGRRT